MTTPFRGLARTAHAADRLILSPFARPTAVSHVVSRQCTASRKRGLHVEKTSESASVERQPTHTASKANVPVSRKKALLDSKWRHPRFGFAAADLPHLIYIKLPRAATEEDVRFLAARAGLETAQILMYYHFENGRPGDFCFLRTADRSKIDAAIADLSRFTLLGSEIKPQKLSLWKAPPQDPPLFAGWLPSTSSDLNARVIRPPMTEPPKLLAAMIGEQWVAFSGLAIDLEDKAIAQKVAEAFYERFHKFEVIGITTPRLHRTKGKTFKILFGNPSHAKAARKLHMNSKFMGKPGKANIHRGGPDVHQALMKYRQSLPEDTPASEISELVEKRFRLLYPIPGEAQRRKDYPTSESAVVAKD